MVELVGPDLGVEVVAGLVKSEEPFDLLGPAGDLVEVAEVVPGTAAPSDIPGGHDDLLEIDVDRGLRLLTARPPVRREHDRGQRRGPPQLPDATHEALPQTWIPGTRGGRSRS